LFAGFEGFPHGEYDDQVDTVTQFHQAATGGRSLGGHTVDAGCGPHA
jgi:phage terminase large subunit-like protein